MVGLDRRLNPSGADCRAHAAKAMFPLSHIPFFKFNSHTDAGAAWRRDSSSPAMPPKRVNAKVSRRSRAVFAGLRASLKKKKKTVTSLLKKSV